MEQPRIADLERQLGLRTQQLEEAKAFQSAVAVARTARASRRALGWPLSEHRFRRILMNTSSRR
jgi:hypothetical protein